LRDLKNLSPQKIQIEGVGTLDWATLADLPLESLNLAGCSALAEFPAKPVGFTRLRTLSLRDTKISELGFVRSMPWLVSLDIEN
jgi:hypothetical protein